MKKHAGKFFLFFTENCTPKVKEFESSEARIRFVGEFYLEHGRSEGYWVDALADGEVKVISHSGFEVEAV